MDYPQEARHFTIDWLNEALAPHLDGARVTRVSARDSAVPGQTAEIVHLDLEYSGATQIPGRLIAKVTSRNPDVIALVSLYDQYRRETSFYNEIPDVGISVPACYYAAHDPEHQRVVILMEDLHPARSPSWAATPEQIEHALGALPAFHARWWNNAMLAQQTWLVRLSDDAFYTAAAEGAHAAIPAVTRHFGSEPETTYELMRIWRERRQDIMGMMKSRPFTFVHGDYHPKQMFFPTADGGRFAVIDWQFPFVAQGAWDLMRLSAIALPTAYRREHQDRLLRDYLAALHQYGVRDYTRDDLDIDARLGLLVSQMIMMIAVADTDISILAKECEDLGVDWKEVAILRTHRAIVEFDVLDFLRHV